MAQLTFFTDYTDFLTTLDNEGVSYFLEGGQAVNLWAEYYAFKSRDRKLDELRPFASKDCDIWVSHSALKYLEMPTRYGTLQKGTSPIDGQIAIFTINGKPNLTVDLMGGVYGIPPEMNLRLNERAINFDGLRVLDPLYLFQSKCYCLVNLPQSERQDKKHLLILSLIIPQYFIELLQQIKNKVITERSMITELKLLLHILKKHQVKEAVKLIGFERAQFFPKEELETSEFLLIQKFTQMTLNPQLKRLP